MERQTLSQFVDSLAPEDALEQMGVEIRKLFSHFPEDERIQFLVGLMRDEDRNEESSLVHLWMATCVAEGIDPSRMCKTLMDKVADSEQLSSAADPGLLILFEDWLERLEEEIIELSTREGLSGASSISRRLGLPRRTCELLIDRLRIKGKLG